MTHFDWNRIWISWTNCICHLIKWKTLYYLTIKPYNQMCTCLTASTLYSWIIKWIKIIPVCLCRASRICHIMNCNIIYSIKGNCWSWHIINMDQINSNPIWNNNTRRIYDMLRCINCIYCRSNRFCRLLYLLCFTNCLQLICLLNLFLCSWHSSFHFWFICLFNLPACYLLLWGLHRHCLKQFIIFFIAGSKKNCYHNQSSNCNHCCCNPLLQCLPLLLQTTFFTLFFFILYATLHVISAISFLSTSFGIAPLIFKCFLAFLFCHTFLPFIQRKEKDLLFSNPILQ